MAGTLLQGEVEKSTLVKLISSLSNLGLVLPYSIKPISIL